MITSKLLYDKIYVSCMQTGPHPFALQAAGDGFNKAITDFNIFNYFMDDVALHC